MAEKWWTKGRDRGVNISQPIRNYQTNIIKTRSNPICRLYEEKTELIDHLVSRCLILTPIDYNERQNKGCYIL